MPNLINLDRLTLPSWPMDARMQFGMVLTALIEDYGAEKIIAFCSSVRGMATEHSDMNLCVVREHPAGCTRPAFDALKSASKVRPLISTDILVRTPDQMDAARRRPFGVMDEVLSHGLSHYES
jgi:predicted nucleotidyltransferase